MIRKESYPYWEYDERCEGYVDYNDFRIYQKSTNTVYETLSIASRATGVSKVAISNDMNKATKEWNRIGNAFRDRKYKYYKCPENFEDARSENRKKAWEKVIARKNA